MCVKGPQGFDGETGGGFERDLKKIPTESFLGGPLWIEFYKNVWVCCSYIWYFAFGSRKSMTFESLHLLFIRITIKKKRFILVEIKK